MKGLILVKKDNCGDFSISVQVFVKELWLTKKKKKEITTK